MAFSHNMDLNVPVMSYEGDREFSFDLTKTPTNSSEDNWGNSTHDEMEILSPIVTGHYKEYVWRGQTKQQIWWKVIFRLPYLFYFNNIN